MAVGLWDHVRIRRSPETESAGVAEREGDVYGFTTPSVTGITDVIGGAPDDFAFNVCLEPDDTALWFRPDLIEFLHHNPGQEGRIGDRRFIRQADGTWTEVAPTMPTGRSKAPATLRARLLRLLGR